MIAADFASLLFALLHAQPFRRFKVTLTSGETFEVDRGNAVAWRSGVAYFVPAVFALHPFNTETTLAFTPSVEG